MSKVKKSFILTCSALFIAFNIYGQAANQTKIWTLKDCIEYAISHNIRIQQSINNQELSKTGLKQSELSRLPSVSGVATNRYNFGQTIDQFTNQFASNRVRSNNFGLNANLNLFSGFQQTNTIKKNRYLYMMDQYQTEKLKNDIALNVAAAFLQVLFNKELLSSSIEQSKQSQLQKEQVETLVKAGSLSKVNLYNIEAQVAKDEYNKVKTKNDLTIARLTLRQLLTIPNNQEFKLATPDVDPADYNLPSVKADNIYATAHDTLPQVKASMYNYMAAEKSLSIARGGRSPQLSFSASYGTGYSGAQSRVTGATPAGVDTIGFTNMGDYVLQPEFNYQTETKPFNEQIKDNVNQSFGFTLSIPILNGWNVNTNIAKAKIQIANAKLSIQSTNQDLMQSIQQAYADAFATKNNMEAAHRQYVASKKAFEYTSLKFETGAINSLDYNNAKTELNNAESTYIQAKYDYIFKLKVLDFYQGKPIRLNE